MKLNVNEILKKIQDMELQLERDNLLRPLTTDLQLDLNIVREPIDQMKLFKGEKS